MPLFLSWCSFIKVSAYPKIHHFEEKNISILSNRSHFGLSLKKKKDWKKVDSKRSYEEKTNLCINCLKLIAVNSLSQRINLTLKVT